MPKGKSKRSGKGKKRSRRPDLSNLDVICPMCAESYLETTNKFTPKKFANAGMLRLKKQYTAEGGGNQWTGPPPDPTAGYGMLECPGCEAPLASEGYLKIGERKATIKDPEKDEKPFFDVINEIDEVLEEANSKDPEPQLPLQELDKNYSGTLPGMEMVILCAECERSFKNKQALSAHMKAHKK